MKITLEKYDNILSMMRSEDNENKVVALTIVDQIVFKDNVTKILLLKKHSKSSPALWEEHAPKTYEKIKELEEKGLLDSRKHLTYKVVLKAITEYQVCNEDYSFYWNDFAKYLTEQAQKDCTTVESININVNYKSDEQSI